MAKAAEGLKPVADKPLTLDAKDLDLESPTLVKALSDLLRASGGWK
jgi:hypothetical protein